MIRVHFSFQASGSAACSRCGLAVSWMGRIQRSFPRLGMTPQISPPIDPVPVDEYPPPVCPILTLAEETFMHDLPELLRHHRNQWTAYHGARRLGIGKTHDDAHQIFRASGLPREHVLIFCIEP